MPKAITASTQDHLPVEDIIDDIVILKDGSAAIIIQTAAVNFGLLSEKEQDATIFAYGALLNSLSHSVQILIRSKKTDISQYLEQLDEAFTKQTNPSLKLQIGKYIDFVKATVQKGKVLDKKFYVIIPFSFLELGATKAAGALTKKRRELPYPKEYLVEQARINLYPKKDQLAKQLTRIGLKGKVLTQPELVELFFDIYNPAATGSQKITAEAGTYTGAIVEPAVDAQAVTAPEPAKPQKPAISETLATPASPTPTPKLQAPLAATPSPVPEPAASAAPPPGQPSLAQSAPSGPTPTGTDQDFELAKNSGNLIGGFAVAPFDKTASSDSTKVLKELQAVIDKAKADLSIKTEGPVPSPQPESSSETPATEKQPQAEVEGDKAQK